MNNLERWPTRWLSADKPKCGNSFKMSNACLAFPQTKRDPLGTRDDVGPLHASFSLEGTFKLRTAI